MGKAQETLLSRESSRRRSLLVSLGVSLGVVVGAACSPVADEWTEASLLRATLVAGRTYRVVVAHHDRAVNMSAFSHFADYTGGSGGASGPSYRVDISALEVLAIAP